MRWLRSLAVVAVVADLVVAELVVLAVALVVVVADRSAGTARRLVADPPNRFAALHLQQASEKLVKAVRLSRGLRVTADHNLEALVDELPHDDPWRAKLRVLEPLSTCATTYRHPSPIGNARVVRATLNLEARASLLKPAAPPTR
jgi:hypothetical protein